MNVPFLLVAAACCADAALKPFPVLRPVPKYLQDEHRMFQSAPSVTVTPGGRLWCAWHTGGENEGEDNCTVVASSGDGGHTWTKPLFAIDAPGPLRVLDPGLWTDPDGKVWFFYSQVYDFWDGRAGVWAMHPEDPENAESAWSPARRLCDGYLKNKPLVKRDGVWLLPVEFMHAEPMSWNLGKGDSVPMTGPQAHPDPSKTTGANVFVSTDKGAHVSFQGQALIPPEARQYPEPMFVEMKDGRLRLFARTAYGIGEAFSHDGGRTWTEVAPSKIKNTSGRFFMGRLASGALLLVKNGPIDQQVGRNRIMAYVSDDDGDTWTGGLVLDERKEVSYPDVAQGRDGAIHIVHDRERRGAQEIVHHVVTEADVRAGKLVASGSRLKDVVNKCLALPLDLKPGMSFGTVGPWDANVADFPRAAGETGDSARILRAVEAAGKGGVVWFPRGEYAVDAMLVVSNQCSLWLHKSAHLKAVREMPYVLKYFGRELENNGNVGGFADHNLFIRGGDIDGAGLASGAQVMGLRHFTLADTTYRNGRKVGLQLGDPSLPRAIEGGYEVVANNLYFICNIPGLAGNVGFSTNIGDSHFTDLVVVDYTVGIRDTKWSNRFTRCHVWGGIVRKPGTDASEYLVDSVAFDLHGSDAVLTDCYADTAMTGFNVCNSARIFNCGYFNNPRFKMDNPTVFRYTSKNPLVVTGGRFSKNSPHAKLFECGEKAGRIHWRDNQIQNFSDEELKDLNDNLKKSGEPPVTAAQSNAKLAG